MPVKFKIAESIDEPRVQEILDDLRHGGVVARQLFPKQKRRSLATIFVVDDPGVDESLLERLLCPYRDEVEFVEGPVERKPTA